jgi:hypothetical protein
MIEVKGILLRNEADEITLNEFEKIFNILQNDEVGKLEQYIKIFQLLGIDENVLDEMDETELIELIKAFNIMRMSDTELVPGFEINGRNYIAYNEVEDFKLKSKSIVEIERYAKKGGEHYPSHILACIFKDEALTKNEHFIESHLKHKAKLFRENIKASIATPYISILAQRTLKMLENAKLD